jgi:hypothetical protein
MVPGQVPGLPPNKESHHTVRAVIAVAHGRGGNIVRLL